MSALFPGCLLWWCGQDVEAVEWPPASLSRSLEWRPGSQNSQPAASCVLGLLGFRHFFKPSCRLSQSGFRADRALCSWEFLTCSRDQIQQAEREQKHQNHDHRWQASQHQLHGITLLCKKYKKKIVSRRRFLFKKIPFKIKKNC